MKKKPQKWTAWDKKGIKAGSLIMREKQRQFDQEVKTLKEFLFGHHSKRKWDFNYTIEVRNGSIKRSIISEVWNGSEFDFL